MSAPMDVLAVMKDAANAIAVYRESFGKDPGIANELDAARAAVADLIDSAQQLSDAIGFRIDDPRVAQHDWLRDALARVGGAK